MTAIEIASLEIRPRRAPSFDRAWVYSGVLLAVGVGLFIVVRSHDAPADASVSFLALLIAFAVLEPFYVPVSFRRSAESITLRELPLAFGLLTGRPAAVVAASVIGPLIAHLLLPERRRPVRVLFNAAQYLVTGSIAALVFDAALGSVSIDRPLAWFAAVAAAVVSSLLSHPLVFLAIWVSEGRPDRLNFVTTTVVAVVSGAMNASLGTLVALIVHDHPPAIALLCLPVLGCAGAYRAMVLSRLRSADLSFLYDAAHMMSVGPNDLGPATDSVLEKLVHSAGADVAAVWLIRGDGTYDRFSSSGPIGTLAPPVGILGELVVDGMVSVGGRRRNSGPERTVKFCSELGLLEAVVHPLVHDDQPLGLLVCGVQHAGGRFRGHQGALLAVFARQLASRFASNRLGEAVDELARQRNELAVRASQDSLTGLANRMLFFTTLEELMKKGRTVTVAFIDLDDFKGVNDTFGHLVGDRVLQHVATSLRTSFRSGDVVARLGGDEFAVLAVDTTRVAAHAAAVRAIATVAQPVAVGSSAVRARISVGVAERCGSESAGMMLARADAALYEAKRAGKGCVVVAADVPVPEHARRALDHGDLRR